MGLNIQAIARQTIVFAYFFAAVLAALYALRGRRSGPYLIEASAGEEPTGHRARPSRFWLIEAVLLLLLGLNKQFNLLSHLTRFGRSLAAGQGMYESRQVLQVEIIFEVILAAGILFGFATSAMRHESRIRRLALVCITFLLLLVLVHSVSLHAFDFLLSRSVAGIPIHWIFELLAISIIIVLTIMAFRNRENGQSAFSIGFPSTSSGSE